MSEELELGGEEAGTGGGTDEGVYDVEAMVDLFSGEDEASAPDGEEGDDGSADPEPAEPGEKTEDAQPGEETPKDAADVPVPEGWENAVWQGLPPEVRHIVHAREQAHAQAMAQAEQERQEVLRRQEQFAVAANAQIQQALATMRQIVEGEYGNVDWNSLAQSDPAAYVRLRQACNARMSAVSRIQQGVAQAAGQYEAARAAEAQKAMASEFARVHPEIRALVGAGFDGRTFASDMAAYMQEQGCPAEVINGLSKAYEVKLVAKAMLYDRLMARRAAAVRKVAEAPKVQEPRGAAPANTGRAVRARALLNRNPNSTDALAALFEAEM